MINVRRSFIISFHYHKNLSCKIPKYINTFDLIHRHARVLSHSWSAAKFRETSIGATETHAVVAVLCSFRIFFTISALTRTNFGSSSTWLMSEKEALIEVQRRDTLRIKREMKYKTYIQALEWPTCLRSLCECFGKLFTMTMLWLFGCYLYALHLCQKYM